MNFKKAVTSVVIVSALALVAGAVSAQGRGLRPTCPGCEVGEVLALVVEQTGLTAREIMLQLREGSTLAELIEANGGDVNAVIAAAVDEATARISQAVEAGRITQAQADTLLAQVEQRVTDAVSGAYGPLMRQLQDGRMGRGRSGPGMHGWGMHGQGLGMGLSADVIGLISEQTGLEVSDILAQMAAGETLGDILRANNVDINAFVDAAVTQIETRMATQAQTRLETLRQRLLDLLGVTQDI